MLNTEITLRLQYGTEQDEVDIIKDNRAAVSSRGRIVPVSLRRIPRDSGVDKILSETFEHRFLSVVLPVVDVCVRYLHNLFPQLANSRTGDCGLAGARGTEQKAVLGLCSVF